MLLLLPLPLPLRLLRLLLLRQLLQLQQLLLLPPRGSILPSRFFYTCPFVSDVCSVSVRACCRRGWRW